MDTYNNIYEYDNKPKDKYMTFYGYRDYDIPLLAILVFVFLIATLYLEQTGFCAFGIRRMASDNSVAPLVYLMVILCIVFVVKIYTRYI